MLSSYRALYPGPEGRGYKAHLIKNEEFMGDCLGCRGPYPGPNPYDNWGRSFIENPFFWAFIISLAVIVILVVRFIDIKTSMHKTDRINSICETIKCTQEGIKKRIDENRELLRLIENHCPQLLIKYPCVHDWIDSQEKYLLAIAELAHVSVRKQN
ncbi:hypothetical protein REL99_004801 [Salmonella enterica]|nr:hypothetical protein [Salmonella enterica]